MSLPIVCPYDLEEGQIPDVLKMQKLNLDVSTASDGSWSLMGESLNQWNQFLVNLKSSKVDVTSCATELLLRLEKELKFSCDKWATKNQGLLSSSFGPKVNSKNTCQESGFVSFRQKLDKDLSEAISQHLEVANLTRFRVIASEEPVRVNDSCEFSGGSLIERVVFFLSQSQIKGDETCTSKLISHLQSQFNRELAIPAACTKKRGSTLSADCKRIIEHRASVIEALEKYRQQEQISKIGVSECLTCSVVQTIVQRSNSNAEIKELQNSLYCSDLKVGESRPVQILNEASQTGLGRSFLQHRVSSDRMVIKIPLQLKLAEFAPEYFVKTGGSSKHSVPMKSASVSQKDRVQEIIRQCMLRFKDRFKLDETTVEIQPTFDPVPGLTPTQILLFDEDFRIKNLAFSTKIEDCYTLLHEVGHHLGFVDEYLETATVDKPNLSGGKISHHLFDCRIPGPVDSLMSSSRSRFQGAAIELSRDCSDSSQEKVKISGENEDISRLTEDFLSNGYKECQREAVSGEPRLYPAHLRELVYPNCKSKNRVYQECAKRAQITSFELKSSKCPEKPPECLGGSGEWLK